MKLNLATAGVIILIGLLIVGIYSTIQFQAEVGHDENQSEDAKQEKTVKPANQIQSNTETPDEKTFNQE
ncbi:hypothetical protein HY572_05000 [Candidatus Micrarchaeota archaeon]|nr:hypothetical protein [Candidatus Micrarchaeota archaeon]